MKNLLARATKRPRRCIRAVWATLNGWIGRFAGDGKINSASPAI
jgi:hypothetical protein